MRKNSNLRAVQTDTQSAAVRPVTAGRKHGELARPHTLASALTNDTATANASLLTRVAAPECGALRNVRACSAGALRRDDVGTCGDSVRPCTCSAALFTR